MTLHECSDAASSSGGGGAGAGAGVLWQGEWNAANTAVVLECVLARVGARELWACGAVCRAWRRAAAEPALWRRLLLPRASPDTLRALAALNVTIGRSDWSWRKEYALEKAHWESCDQVLPPSGGSAPLLCATLHSEGNFLALVDEDSRLTIYEHVRPKLRVRTEAEWRIQWSDLVKTEWRSISWAQWAPSTPRLLLAGRLALADRYEMLCIQFDEEWCSTVVCRSASGPGGAGCWVDDTNFLSMRLQLLAPGHACTTVWLNAASQETYSEFAGVTAPLLRIYNEASTHISHILVANVPKLHYDNSTSMFGNNADIDTPRDPNASYYKTLQKGTVGDGETKQILIGAGGVPGGERGVAEAVLVWALPALELPILWVEDHLAQRVQQHRLRLQAAQQQPDHEPDVDIMRALCTPPVSSCSLLSRILGMVIHPNGGCLWATTETGATCLSLPALSPLLRLPRSPPGPLLPPHYIIPSVNDDFFISPAGGGSGCVDVWMCRSGRGAGQLQHRSPALAVFLLPHRQRPPAYRILVLTVNAIHVVRRLSNGVDSGVHGRRSCAPVEVQECTPCLQTPKPQCRKAPAACPLGLRVVCCPPSPGARPPCSPPLSSSPLTCTDVKLWETTTKTCNLIKSKGNNTNACGVQLDRVARRIEDAKRARRADYEREVSAKDTPKSALPAPSVSYKLAGERECMRATDGRDYAVTITENKMNRCDQSRNPPPPCPVNLEPVDRCEVNREHHLDPCSHQPRIFLEINRNSHSTVPSKQSPASLTTRFVESFKRSGSVSPRQACGLPFAEGSTANHDHKSRCTKLPTPNSVPPRCKELSITERLRRRPGGTCSESCNPQRQLHTKINLCGYNPNACSSPNASEITNKQKKTSLDKVASIIQEKSNLKEAGQGRVVTSHEKTNKNHNIGSGGLELKVPPSTDAVRVRVLLDFSSAEPRNCKTDSVLEAIDTQNVSSSASTNGTEPWLSLKNLQQKLSGRRKSETVLETKKSNINDNCPKQSPKRPPSASPSACSEGNNPPIPTLCPTPSQSKQTSSPSQRSPCPPSDSKTRSQFVSAQDQVQFC